MDNSGGTLVLNGASGSWSINGGTLRGGAVNCDVGVPLLCSGGTLDGVAVNGVLDVGNT